MIKTLMAKLKVCPHFCIVILYYKKRITDILKANDWGAMDRESHFSIDMHESGIELVVLLRNAFGPPSSKTFGVATNGTELRLSR